MTTRKQKWPASDAAKAAATPRRPLQGGTSSTSPTAPPRRASTPAPGSQSVTSTRTASSTRNTTFGSAPDTTSPRRSSATAGRTAGSSLAGGTSRFGASVTAGKTPAAGVSTAANISNTFTSRRETSSPSRERTPASSRARSSAGTASTPAERSPTATNTFSKGREMAAAAARAVAENAAQTSTTARREFALSASDFDEIRKRIYKHAGIVLTPSKQDMVYGRLARRLRFHRLSSFADYLALLDKDRAEWELFVNALTTNLTSFFREPHHFERLAKQLQKAPKGRPYRIWCCAASTGEEPYSLAITACEAFDTLSPPVRIVATDLNTEVIAEARTGIYDKNRVSGLSAARMQRFFTALKKPDSRLEQWQINAQLRQLVEFDRLNLLEPNWPVSGPFDAIFCRNVMIYFDRDTQYQILKRFVPLLTTEGELYAGHSESFLYASEIFRNVGKTVYQRVGA